MTKEEAIVYCYAHKDEYMRDCYDAHENGQRLFDCLVDCLESGHIKPEELVAYGMEYDEDVPPS
jgi:hypothetical protein